MTEDSYGAEFLTKSETIDGSWEYNENTFDLKVKDISMGSLELLQEYMRVGAQAMNLDGDVDEEKVSEVNQKAEDLDPLPWEDDSEYDGFVECTIDQKLLKPDVEVSEARAPKMQAVFEGMMEAWSEGNR